MARELYRRLAAVRAGGEVIPSAYREPKITQEQARQIAERELRRICAQEYPGQHFGPIYPYMHSLRWWVFYTVSEEMLQEQERR